MFPNLDNVIAAYECYDNSCHPDCEHCPYGYGYLDNNYDTLIWSCNGIQLEHDVIGYLKLFQHLIQEEKKK
jgi:hypothetical protein